MNHRLARLTIAIVAMITIWESHSMDSYALIAFAACLVFVAAGTKEMPQSKLLALFYEIRNIYAADVKRLKGAWK